MNSDTVNNTKNRSAAEQFGYAKDNLTKRPADHYMEEYAKADPQEIASRLHIPYDEEKQELTITLMGITYTVSWPDFEITVPGGENTFYSLSELPKARILVLRFLLNGADLPSKGTFKTYREMPWGEVYLRQFDGRCIKRLAFSYGNRLDVFRRIMEYMNGTPVKHGDAAYEIEIFPGYKMQLILWEGDDEFPPSSQILFSENYPASFEAEDMAVMGDVLIDTLKALSKII